MKTSRACLFALCATIVVAGKIQAQSIPDISIEDTDPNDLVIITGTGFGAFTVNNSGNGTPFNEADGSIFFKGTWLVDAGTGTEGSRTLYLTEAQDHDLISDILSFGYTFTPGEAGAPDRMFISGSFQSDVEGDLGTMEDLPVAPAAGDIFVEDGTPVDFSNAVITGHINSDVDSVVPEPSTWAACGFVALLAGGTLVRRFRR